jgi:putative heme-binding domain-containing protein
MKITHTLAAPILLFLLFANSAFTAPPPVRQPWTASRIQGSPEPPKPYVAETVFNGLAINEGLEMVALNGRLFVVERRGKIWSFEENATVPKADLFVDMKTLKPTTGNVYGLAFHPDWQTNRQVFLTYTDANNDENGTALSRFRFSSSDRGAPRLEPDSEEVIFRWRSGGHNGANLQFGSDGMLYVSTGDASAPNPPDGLHTGQDNSDLLSCVLRIDINHRDKGLNYRVPPDNPFVGRAGVRPEIWAFGFRNPWKMSFDSKDRLWLGDVGWELWEMIHRVEKGGNYGWSAMEAGNPIKPGSASPLAPISPPVAAHSHTESASITGGFEYRGTRLPKLRGAYVYGDYETGKIWALRHDGRQVTEHIEIADTPHRISTFGVGNDGGLYYINYASPSTICRLTPNPRAGNPSDFPKKLSQTGLFTNTTKQRPNAGVYEFAVHEPMWQDGAEATRYVALPETNSVHTDIVYQQNGSRRITTTWPNDAVLAKTIRLGKTPVETQVLHFDGSTWNGYSYRWNKTATDATLVAAGGDEFEVSAADWQGGTRYRISSRAECLRCHSTWNKFTPAFEPMQLAEFTRFPRKSPQQVATELGLANADFFHQNDNGHLLNSRGRGSLEKRARSWLHANCAHCHRRHGGGTAPLEVNYERALSESFTLWQKPTRGDFGLTDPHLIVPGHPARSVLNYRVSAIGASHMPPIGPREVDDHGANLLWQWIAKLPSQTPPQTIPIGLLDEPWLSDTSPALRLTHAIASGEFDQTTTKGRQTEGLSSGNQNVRALFERFRTASERPAPAQLNPDRILSLRGHPQAGATLLTPTGKLAACFACHQLGDVGRDLGPNLNGIAARLNRQQILESLIHPSKTIAPEYRIWSVETNDGETQSGFIIDRTDKSLTLKLTTGQPASILAGKIEATKPSALSLMPEGLLLLLTEQETADLLAYLETLKQTAP